MKNFTSKMLLAAKVMAAKDWTAPKVIMAARHLANEGKTLSEIHSFLEWGVGEQATRLRLAKYRIFPFSKVRLAHRGKITRFSSHYDDTDTTSFRAKELNVKPVIPTVPKFKCLGCKESFPQPKKGRHRVRCVECAGRYMAFHRSEVYHQNKILATKGKC